MESNDFENGPSSAEERPTAGENAEFVPGVPQQQAPSGNFRTKMLMVLVAIVIIGFDQFTKYLVESNLQLFEVYAPLPAIEPVFRIMHVYNTGAAFGIFPGGGQIFAILAVVVSLLILFYNFSLPGGHHSLRLALGLQLGGALGNFIDRLRIGHVTDFLDVGPWPLFNIADMSIVAGAVILGWMMLQEAREVKAAEKKSEAKNDGLFPPVDNADEWSL